MSKLALAADGSAALQGLVQQQQIRVEYLKVGPWMGHEHLQHVSSHYPVLLHCNDSVLSPRFSPTKLNKLVTQTQTPWLSVHLGFPLAWFNALWQRFAVPMPLFPRQLATRLAVRNIRSLQQHIGVPVAIENQAQYQRNGHQFIIAPAFITHLVRATGVDLLLDVGHAAVSAKMLGISFQAYVQGLPTEHIVELHVHRPGWRRGHLRDLHLALQDEDYTRLKWLLDAGLPRLRAVTLEYYGATATLLAQLQQLRQLVDIHSAVPNTDNS